jgi:hypothetical protein
MAQKFKKANYSSSLGFDIASCQSVGNVNVRNSLFVAISCISSGYVAVVVWMKLTSCIAETRSILQLKAHDKNVSMRGDNGSPAHTTCWNDIPN